VRSWVRASSGLDVDPETDEVVAIVLGVPKMCRRECSILLKLTGQAWTGGGIVAVPGATE